MYTDDNNIAEEARNWINTLTVGNLWNVRLIQQKYRVNAATGARKALPTRLRRYAEGCPPTCMKAAMDYLLEQAPYTGIVFRGEKLEGYYRPTKTEWTYDAGDAVNPAAGKNDATFTLVQDLVEDSEADTLDAGSSVNCTEEVTAEWHWDESSVEDLPDPEQGVTWAIQSLGRSEDGTFSYALIKRKAITSHMDPVTIKGTATETVTRETWKNLYGEPWNFTDDTGASVQVQQSGYDASTGTTVETQVQKNDDCTYDVVTTATTAVSDTIKESSTHTQYEGQHSISKLGQSSPLGIAPDAEGGVIQKYDDQLQPDGRYSTQKDITVERPVQESKVTISITRKGKRTTRVDTNQSEPASAPTKVGETASFEKTPGRLYNNTTSSWDKSQKITTGERCEIDLYKHDHTVVEAGGSGEPTGTTHVDGSGTGGHVKTKDIETDDEGAVTVTNRDNLELPVKKSKETWRVKLTGVEHQYTDTQVTDTVKEPSWSKKAVGTAVSTEQTPGGLRNNTYTETKIPDNLDEEVGLACSKTIFEHTDKTTRVTDGSDDQSSHVKDAGDGIYYDQSSQLNDDATTTLSETKHQELSVPSARVTIRRTAKAVVTTTVDKNTNKKLATVPGFIGTVEHSYNPGGTTDYTVTKVTVTNNPDRAACSSTVFEHRDETQATSTGVAAHGTHVSSGGGYYRSFVSTVDDNGVVTDTTTTTEEIEQAKARVEYKKTTKFTVKSETTKNTSKAATIPSKAGESESHTMNPGGTYDLTKVTLSFDGSKHDRSDTVDTVDSHIAERQTHIDQSDVEDDAPGVGTVTVQWKGVDGTNGYKRIVEAIDDNGVRTVTETDTKEKTVDDFRVVKQADHFKSVTERTIRHSTLKPDEDSAKTLPQRELDDRGVMKSYTYSVNTGGSVDRVLTETTPYADDWEEPLVNGGRAYKRVWHFRNFKYNEYTSKFTELEQAFADQLATWGNAGTAPSSVDVTPSSNLNDYGLFDGTVTLTARWAAGEASPGESANAVFTDKTFTVVSIKQGRSSSSTEVDFAIQSSTQRYIVGRGTQLWDNLCAQYHTHLDGSLFNYAYSGPFTIRVTTAVQKAYIDKKKNVGKGQNIWDYTGD